MPLALYQGYGLVPGMGSETYSAEHDFKELFYSKLTCYDYVTYAVIDGSSVDTGNTNNTTVLRPGLVMSQVTTGGKWKPFVSGAVDGTQWARGILLEFGLNTQYDAANTDRFLATILIKGGILNPEGICIASTAGYGLARSGVGLTIRKHFKYNFAFSDDFMGDLIDPLSGR